jgi:hypothetical protein
MIIWEKPFSVGAGPSADPVRGLAPVTGCNARIPGRDTGASRRPDGVVRLPISRERTRWNDGDHVVRPVAHVR